jgi:hypothetical protein
MQVLPGEYTPTETMLGFINCEHFPSQKYSDIIGHLFILKILTVFQSSAFKCHVVTPDKHHRL